MSQQQLRDMRELQQWQAQQLVERANSFWWFVIFVCILSLITSLWALRAFVSNPSARRIWAKSVVLLSWQLPPMFLSLLGLAFFGWTSFFIGFMAGITMSVGCLLVNSASATEQQVLT